MHPIFILSIADFMLGMLWVLGGGLWLRRSHNMDRVWCFSASLMTVVGRQCGWCGILSGIQLLVVQCSHYAVPYKYTKTHITHSSVCGWKCYSFSIMWQSLDGNSWHSNIVSAATGHVYLITVPLCTYVYPPHHTDSGVYYHQSDTGLCTDCLFKHQAIQ